jgi:hypothetical protein
MFGFGPGSNNSKRKTFWAFLGHSFLQGKVIHKLCSSYASDAVTIFLTASVEKCDSTCALRLSSELQWDCTASLPGIPGLCQRNTGGREVPIISSGDPFDLCCNRMCVSHKLKQSNQTVLFHNQCDLTCYWEFRSKAVEW